MADRYLLESGAPDGYLLEDGTGVLLLEVVPITGTLSVTLDDVAFAASGTTGHTGAEATTLDDITAALAGTLGHSGTLAATLGDVSVSAAGTSGHSGPLAVTLDDIAFDASGTVAGAAAITGTLAVVLDDVSADASGVVGHSGDLAITLGDISVQFDGPADSGAPDYGGPKKRRYVNYLPHMLGLPDEPETVAVEAQAVEAHGLTSSSVEDQKPANVIHKPEWDDEEDIELLLLAV